MAGFLLLEHSGKHFIQSRLTHNQRHPHCLVPDGRAGRLMRVRSLVRSLDLEHRTENRFSLPAPLVKSSFHCWAWMRPP